jgi:hypothetical protein
MLWCASPANAKRRRLAARLLWMLAVVPGLAPTSAAAEIVWRVENPFRLFTDPATTALHRTALDQLSADERASPVLSVERWLAIAAPRGWAEAVVARTCWSDRDQRYTCTEATDYAHPTQHRVVVGVAGAPDGACRWTVIAPTASVQHQPKLSTLRVATRLRSMCPIPTV